MTLPWGDASGLQFGEYVLAVGNLFGLTSTVTLVGINTAIFSQTGGYQGVGFAVSTTMAKPI